MKQPSPKFIGERISFVKTKEQLSIIITQEVPRWKETLLLTWLMAWVFVGVFFIFELTQRTDQQERMFFTIVIAFWAFFLVRIGKAYLWRKGGREMIWISPGELTIKNGWWNYGKAKTYFLDNVKGVSLIPVEPKNFMQSLDRSFWVVGGENVAIKYMKKELRVGKQLEEREARQLVMLIDKSISEFRRKSQKKSVD
ncbi:hypothetical protein [Halocola ammonii]